MSLGPSFFIEIEPNDGTLGSSMVKREIVEWQVRKLEAAPKLGATGVDNGGKGITLGERN